ncbi:MAG: DUF2059 domain-containing protein [Longimicrobiaceae bacterium]
MRRLALLALACALLLPLRAAAQNPATPPTPGQIAAARELLEVMHIQEISTVGVKAAFDGQISANPMLEPYRATMVEWATEIFASEEAKAAFTNLYASSFSEEDLRALVAFYRTPLGQRLTSNMAALAEKGAQIGQQLATAHQAELMERIQRVTPKP